MSNLDFDKINKIAYFADNLDKIDVNNLSDEDKDILLEAFNARDEAFLIENIKDSPNFAKFLKSLNVSYVNLKLESNGFSIFDYLNFSILEPIPTRAAGTNRAKKVISGNIEIEYTSSSRFSIYINDVAKKYIVIRDDNIIREGDKSSVRIDNLSFGRYKVHIDDNVYSVNVVK